MLTIEFLGLLLFVGMPVIIGLVFKYVKLLTVVKQLEIQTKQDKEFIIAIHNRLIALAEKIDELNYKTTSYLFELAKLHNSK